MPRLGTTLTGLRDRVAAGQPVTVVAFGSSSTSGAGASAPQWGYPNRLAAELATLFPNARVRVLNKGVGGETTRQMVARLDRDVLAHKPDLVIWQAGTNELLRREDTAQYVRVLSDGIRRLKAAGVDVILMDAQYAPSVIAQPRHAEFVAATRRVAEEERVGLFSRFAVMQYWSRAGGEKAPRVLDPDGLHMNDLGCGCIAHLLATAVAETLGSQMTRSDLSSQ
ncbi:MAG: SGNH/GDSL hydrolase family protein [Rhodospirillales bacterium]|nr:SGNH/GDSL hydrolase family protein [Rhodospirillales bacterium]